MSITIIKKGSEYLDYILAGIERNDVHIIDVSTKESLFWRAVHLLANGRSEHPKRFLSSYISRDNIREIKSIKDDNVLFLGAIDHRLSNILCGLVPMTIKKHSWMWNPLGLGSTNRILSELDYSRSLGLLLSTFNPKDAEHYNIPYLHQVFRYPGIFSSTESNEISSDCYWLGAPKGRLEIIKDIKAILENKGLRCDFRIIEKDEDRISYMENLALIQSTMCLVDLNKEDNMGLSLRVMEALFFNKKLITNNAFIKTCEFYNSNNVFVLGEDDISELPSFIASPFRHVDERILSQYDINDWLSFFEKQ